MPLGTQRQRDFAQALRDMHDAGWPRATSYGDPANQTDRETWAFIAEAIVDDEMSRRLVLQLGPCAATNVPRALFLLGLTDEGGPTGRPLPSTLDDWPVVAGVDDLTTPDPLEGEC